MHRRHATWDWLTRRAFLGTAAGAAAGVYGLAQGLAAEVPSTFDGKDFTLRAPEANAKRGGVLRYGVLSAPAHFDVHQSGTVSNMGTQGCMYDNLIRRDPRDSGQTIIPDLAHSWEIAKDGKTYTFFLRKGVKFHDGGDFTAEDVKATYQRIISPPQGFSSPRTALFTYATAEEMNVRDSHTIEFKFHEPRPKEYILGAFASGWNIIVRKKTLEDNNYNLRQVMDYPGTGPFRHKKRVDKEVWVMERNPDYWNEGLPYLDGIEFYHFDAFSPPLGAALLSGRVDYARLLDPVSLKKVQETPGMTGTNYYQSVIQAVWVNNAKKPFDDPRVRRAMHLAFDRPALVEVVKEVAPMLVGGFIYPFSDWATPPPKLSERLGYQSDTRAAIKEAKQLLAAAGHANGIKGVDFMVRDVPSFKTWAPAIQEMLKEIGIETNLRTVQVSVWFEEAQASKFDITISAIVSTLIDPSDYFRSWYSKDGPQNYSKWNNQAFEDLLPQIDRALDEATRKDLVRKAEAIFEQDPPLLPVSWEKINDGWYNYVKGHNPYNYFGIYDAVRFDTFWLDK
ncbi:MAG TPA: ABC transporter substrate-binding protein [Candidatus Tectomicrobia bacterium]